MPLVLPGSPFRVLSWTPKLNICLNVHLFRENVFLHELWPQPISIRARLEASWRYFFHIPEKKFFLLKIVSGNVCDERESFRFYFGILLRWMSLLGTRAEDVYANCPKNHYNIWGLRPMSREGTAIYMPATNQWCARQNVVLDISQLYFIATFFFSIIFIETFYQKVSRAAVCVSRERGRRFLWKENDACFAKANI